MIIANKKLNASNRMLFVAGNVVVSTAAAFRDEAAASLPGVMRITLPHATRRKDAFERFL
jgi:hypothetical protein